MTYLPAMSNTPSRALVTGGTGFIGSHLVRFLQQQGWEVHLLVRAGSSIPNSTLQTYSGSTADVMRAIERSRPDVVFHLASFFSAQHSPEQVLPLVQANVLLGTQLLEAMQSVGVQALVNTGTSWQHYGEENYRPVNLYAATKQAFEDVLAYYCDTGSVHAITLKLFDSYGPNDNRKKLLSLLMEGMKHQRDLLLSGGEQVLDLVHVDDICRAYLRAASLVRGSGQPGCSTYAVSGNERRTLRQIVALLEQVAGRSIPVSWGARPYRAREVMRPWDGPALPGWEPVISLEDGLRMLLHEQR